LLYFQLELLVFQLTNKIDTFFELYDVFQNILAFNQKKLLVLYEVFQNILAFHKSIVFLKYNVLFQKYKIF